MWMITFGFGVSRGTRSSPVTVDFVYPLYETSYDVNRCDVFLAFLMSSVSRGIFFISAIDFSQNWSKSLFLSGGGRFKKYLSKLLSGIAVTNWLFYKVGSSYC